MGIGKKCIPENCQPVPPDQDLVEREEVNVWEDETDRQLDGTMDKLLELCSRWETGEQRSHDEILAAGWLNDDDEVFLTVNGMKVEAVRRVEGEPWFSICLR